MELKIKKVEKILPLTVQAQECTNNCQETVWAGKTKSGGNAAGCWSTTAETARGAWW